MMEYVSTRGGAKPASFSQALVRGLAPDGGLYVPARWPANSMRAAPGGLPEVAAETLRPFLAGDVLESELEAVTAEAFNFPAPLTPLTGEPAHVLQLFHGPTAAFKDFGVRFLAQCMARLRRDAARTLHILVATSGDTGGAVAAAFHQAPKVRVSVLYPKGQVSPAQERQLTQWGGNIQALVVRGAFDDCQRLVKQAFADAELRRAFDLSSANSINVGRLLPQMAYFAASSRAIWNEFGQPASFVIPSGNLGNATACVWARQIGLPIGEIVLAHNSNRAMPDYLMTGEWPNRATIATIASAMDVGNPSNAERLRHLFSDIAGLRGAVSAYSIDDDAIRACIRTGFERYGQFWCPHTAAAAEAYARHLGANARGRWVIAATAHAAKFPEIVEPLVGRQIPMPTSLEAVNADGAAIEIEPTLAALRAELLT